MSAADTYRTTFSRALHAHRINGFNRRYLDADDHAFLDYVRRTGLANGSVPGRTPAEAFDEEIVWWQSPTEIERTVRRIGAPRSYIRPSDWKSPTLHQRAVDKAAMAHELAVEYEQWAQQKQREVEAILARRKRQRQADIDWENADPRGPRFYVPEWRRMESIATRYAENVSTYRKLAKRELLAWRARKRMKEAEKIEAEKRLLAEQHAENEKQAAALVEQQTREVLALAEQQTREAVRIKEAERAARQRATNTIEALKQQQTQTVCWGAGLTHPGGNWPRPDPGNMSVEGHYVYVWVTDLGRFLTKHSENVAFEERRGDMVKFVITKYETTNVD